MINKYKIVKEEVTVSPNNKKHSLVDATIEMPDGREVVWQYIKSKSVVSIVALNSKNEIYCVRQWRPARKDFVWELPAGGVENEDPKISDVLENANRELQEEIGLKASKIELVNTFTPSIHMTSRFYIVLATNLIESPLPKDEDEDLEVRIIPLEEAYKLLIEDQIPSAMTLVGMLFAKKYIK